MYSSILTIADLQSLGKHNKDLNVLNEGLWTLCSLPNMIHVERMLNSITLISLYTSYFRYSFLMTMYYVCCHVTYALISINRHRGCDDNEYDGDNDNDNGISETVNNFPKNANKRIQNHF